MNYCHVSSLPKMLQRMPKIMICCLIHLNDHIIFMITWLWFDSSPKQRKQKTKPTCMQIVIDSDTIFFSVLKNNASLNSIPRYVCRVSEHVCIDLHLNFRRPHPQTYMLRKLLWYESFYSFKHFTIFMAWPSIRTMLSCHVLWKNQS